MFHWESFWSVGSEGVRNDFFSCSRISRILDMKKTANLYMGQVTKLRLSCYLVLLSIDTNTRRQDSRSFVTCPIYHDASTLGIYLLLPLGFAGLKSAFVGFHIETFVGYWCFKILISIYIFFKCRFMLLFLSLTLCCISWMRNNQCRFRIYTSDFGIMIL